MQDLYKCAIYIYTFRRKKKNQTKQVLSFCERPGTAQHSKFAKDYCQFYKLDYLLVNQKVKTTGMNDPSEQ